MFWSIDDVNNGLCDVGDVGKPRPPVVAVPPPEVDPDVSLRQQLRNDSARAYAAVGGVDFLKANPELLSKLLVRSLPPEGVNDPNQKADEMPMPTWLKAQRLSYQIVTVASRDISPDDDSPWVDHPQALRQMIHDFLTAHPEIYEAAQAMYAKLGTEQPEAPELPAAKRRDPFAGTDD
ncbi:hypothetical protein QTH97_02315 [Variovorax sp. J22R24]|uniref:hypothetical protein n=1 Tax=Variovorax gracilis TaxID=3053502 RepID=UPI0025789332|nr:hypothetical protein [Variovorax sp. J22R24]MDM0103751.1 hypothetical protein [Variovorax sp. J22R24]